MHVPSKLLILSQIIGSLIIVILISHACSHPDHQFGASPSTMALFQLATSHLFLSFFVFVTALSTDKIYETPLICMHGLLFFILLLATGILSIAGSINFQSLQDKEIGAAGVFAIFTAFMCVAGCCFSYKICENLKTI